MEVLHSAWLRLTALFRRRRLDRDLDDEVAFHLAMREQRLRAGGDLDARLAARRAFGNVVTITEETRMAWTFRWLEHLAQDARYATRSLRKSPALAAVVVLSLALGIGANTAIFSLIDAVMLRMLPVEKPQELMEITRRIGAGPGGNSFTNPLWEALREQQDVFSSMLAWSTSRFDLAQGGAAQYVNGMFVSGDYFRALGIRPALGRLISTSDDQRGCPSLAVLSYGFWQSHYGGAGNALGSSLSLSHHPFTVIGVAAPGFYGTEVGTDFDIAIPVCSSTVFDGKRSRLDARSWWWLSILGRLKPGVTPQQAQARLAVLSPAIAAAALPTNWASEDQQRFLKSVFVPQPGATGLSYLRHDFAQPLNILMGIVALVLLIACANIASLLLARATTRSREIAIRNALGASRNRLIRQLLTESLLLSAIGAAAGLLFARWASVLLVHSLATRRQQVFVDLSLDGRVLAFTVAIAVLTGILVGLLPAWRSTRVSLMAAMKGSRTAEEERHSRFRAGKWIVGSQIAVSLLLLISGGLLLRSFVKLLTLDLGFDRSNVLLVNADLRQLQVPPERRAALYDDLAARLRGLPGVQFVSRSFTTPLSNHQWNEEVLADAPHPPSGDQALSWFNAITPHYFQVLRTPLLAGRGFGQSDTRTAPQVAIVTEAFARTFFPGENVLGKRFQVKDDPGKPMPYVEIVGIVKDAKYANMREEPQPTAFVPMTQARPELDGGDFELRTLVPPSSLIPAVQQAVASLNKEIPLEFHNLNEQVNDNLVQARLLATLSAFFGALALLLAMIGLYGVLSYLVTHRQTEFGIRMALGARPASILQLVLRDVAVVLGGGMAAGLAISLAAVTVLRKMLFGLAPRDAVTMVLAVVVLTAVALLAGFLPARRAARVDPMVALRYE